MSVADLEVVREQLAELPLSGQARQRWLRALARTDHAAVLGDADWWRGASLGDLGPLDQDLRLGAILRAHPEILRKPVTQAVASGPQGLGLIFGLPPDLLANVDSAVVAAAVDRLDASHPIRAIAERHSAAAVTSERASNDHRLVELQREHRSEIDRLQGEIQSLQSQLDGARNHATEIAGRLRNAIADTDADRSAQLRQARIDALRVVAAMAAQLERALPGLTNGALGADEVMNAVLGEAGKVGVVRDAPIGASVELDRTKYQLINDDGTPNGTVTVVEPAFMSDADGTVTTLQYGKVAASRPPIEAG